MSRRSGAVTKSEVKAAVEGARAGGMEVGRVVVHKDGIITIIAAKPTTEEAAQVNEWDE